MKNKDREKLRKIKFLMYANPIFWDSAKNRKIMTELYESYKDKEGVNKKKWDELMEMMNLYKLIDELGLSEEEVNQMWSEISTNKYKSRVEYNKRPLKEGRDNKDVHVGSGGSNANKVRYPSKKRSLKTWKKFYNLFPYFAKKDGWDGKTSKRMK